MTRAIRRHFGLKLFLSYLVIIGLGVVVLATATELVIPSSFDRHIASMMGDTGMAMGMGDMGMNAGEDLFIGFKAAVFEALGWASLAAVLAAVVVSLFVSRRVVAPVLEIKQASRRIADGNYEERVRVPGHPAEGDELAQLAVSFNRMAETLHNTEALRRQLIGDVAHELRTPLTTIKGSLEGLLDGVLLPDPETYQDIYREADRMQRLVNDLQELSRVEASAVPLQIRPTDLTALIHTILRQLEPQFADKGVYLSAKLPEGALTVPADVDRITQVLTNLVGNALQYTPRGEQVTIALSPRSTRQMLVLNPALDAKSLQAKDWLLVEIQDTGIGIPPEHLSFLFDRFYRVDKSRSRAGGGSGIGLTIARHLVEAHGGQIWAKSAGPGKGSTFAFALPAA